MNTICKLCEAIRMRPRIPEIADILIPTANLVIQNFCGDYGRILKNVLKNPASVSVAKYQISWENYQYLRNSLVLRNNKEIKDLVN